MNDEHPEFKFVTSVYYTDIEQCLNDLYTAYGNAPPAARYVLFQAILDPLGKPGCSFHLVMRKERWPPLA